jgi:hypothetical protein
MLMVVLMSGLGPPAVSHESGAASRARTSAGGAATSTMPPFGSSLPLGHCLGGPDQHDICALDVTVCQLRRPAPAAPAPVMDECKAARGRRRDLHPHSIQAAPLDLGYLHAMTYVFTDSIEDAQRDCHPTHVAWYFRPTPHVSFE